MDASTPVHPTQPLEDAHDSARRETVYLTAIPGLADRLKAAATAPDEDFVDLSEVDL